MTTTCPGCGAVGNGKFCADCGTSLTGGVKCAGCGHEPPTGAQFCNMCGHAVGGRPAARAVAASGEQAGRPPLSASGKLPWLTAGVAVVMLAAVLLIPRLRGEPEPAFTMVPDVSSPAAGPSSIDLDTMTPREAADRLFDRVMRSVAAGDSATAVSFAPMAISAYELAEPLDLDGRYHVGTLHLVAGDTEAATLAATEMLEEVPTHLLGLVTAAQAALAEGRVEDARSYYIRLTENFESEIASARVEYADHAPLLPEIRREAEAFVME